MITSLIATLMFACIFVLQYIQYLIFPKNENYELRNQLFRCAVVFGCMMLAELEYVIYGLGILPQQYHSTSQITFNIMVASMIIWVAYHWFRTVPPNSHQLFLEFLCPLMFWLHLNTRALLPNDHFFIVLSSACLVVGRILLYIHVLKSQEYFSAQKASEANSIENKLEKAIKEFENAHLAPEIFIRVIESYEDGKEVVPRKSSNHTPTTERQLDSPLTASSLLPDVVTEVPDKLQRLEMQLTTEYQKQLVADLKRHFEHLLVYRNLFDAVVPPQYQQLIAPFGIEKLTAGTAVVKQISVLFSDIRDFSTIAEQSGVHTMLDFFNTYLSFALPPITTHGGFVDKFIGDSIMCIFAESSHASNAIKCAIDMMRNLEFMKKLEGFRSCETGIGINTGSCTIGVVGTETRLEPTVLGDDVNLASRMESLCKMYGAKILITHQTKESLKRADAEVFLLRLLDHVRVFGKKNPCEVYEVVDGESDEQIFKLKRKIMEIWPDAVRSFRQKNFVKALRHFQRCKHLYPNDIASSIYINRCLALLQVPPEGLENWGAVYELVQK